MSLLGLCRPYPSICIRTYHEEVPGVFLVPVLAFPSDVSPDPPGATIEFAISAGVMPLSVKRAFVGTFVST